MEKERSEDGSNEGKRDEKEEKGAKGERDFPDLDSRNDDHEEGRSPLPQHEDEPMGIEGSRGAGVEGQAPKQHNAGEPMVDEENGAEEVDGQQHRLLDN